MKNKYEVYTFAIDKNGNYIVTTDSEIIEGYKKAKERFDFLKKRNNDKHFDFGMCKIDDYELEEGSD